MLKCEPNLPKFEKIIKNKRNLKKSKAKTPIAKSKP